MKYNITVKKLPQSEVEISCSLEASLLEAAHKKAFEMIGLSLDVPGFRKGHIPQNIILEKVGERFILEEAADILLKEHFPKIVLEEKLDLIGRPQIAIKKLALGNPFEFSATIAVMPEVKLPDYKKLASAVMNEATSAKIETTATEGEVDEVLLQIRKNKAHFDWHKMQKEKPLPNPPQKGGSQNEGHEAHAHIDFNDEKNLPVLDDEFAKAAGNFKNLAELKEKVKENLEKEKELKNIEKRRAKILDQLVEATKIDVPKILVESEIDKSLAQMKDSVTQMGLTWEAYLSNSIKDEQKNKDSKEVIAEAEAKLREDLKESALKKAKTQLIFNEIATKENIKIDETVLQNEVQTLLTHYPDAKEESARIYVSTILMNSEVLKLLEKASD